MNPRYHEFKHMQYYTADYIAGDEEQFMKYAFRTEGSTDVRTIDTFRYLFYKFKKGLFVRIRDNQIETFLPFSNVKYCNEWSHLIQGELPFWIKGETKQRERWYGNNGLIRYEPLMMENGDRIHEIKDMLDQCCKTETVKDIDFFVNRRDFPQLAKQPVEAHQHFFGVNAPLRSHRYDDYSPLFSMTSSDEFKDICIPSYQDWTTSLETDMDSIDMKQWKEKISIAFFRGSSTGIGVNEQTNPRLKLAKWSIQYPRHLDCKLTSLNKRPRVWNGKITWIDKHKYNDCLTNAFIPFEDQKKYKYIVYVDGHCAALRLARDLSLGCVLLMVESKWTCWAHSFMENNIHYISIKSDFSDLIEKIEWCRQHDDECLTIANNALDLGKHLLAKQNMTSWIAKMINSQETKNIQRIHYASSDYCAKNKYPIRKIKQNYYGEIVFSSNSTIVEKIRMNSGKHIISKFKKNQNHAFQVGMHVQQCSDIFMKTFAFNGSHLFCEFIEYDMTLFDYLKDPYFCFNVFYEVLKKVSMALDAAFEKFEFIHYDLAPWNILLSFHNGRKSALKDCKIIDFEWSILRPNLQRKQWHIPDNQVFIDGNGSYDIVFLLLFSFLPLCEYYQGANKNVQLSRISNLFSAFLKLPAFRTVKDAKAFVTANKSFSQLKYSQRDHQDIRPRELFRCLTEMDHDPKKKMEEIEKVKPLELYLIEK